MTSTASETLQKFKIGNNFQMFSSMKQVFTLSNQLQWSNTRLT